jgi:hypothetical protein
MTPSPGTHARSLAARSHGKRQNNYEATVEITVDVRRARQHAAFIFLKGKEVPYFRGQNRLPMWSEFGR